MHVGGHFGGHLGELLGSFGPPLVVVPALPKHVRLVLDGASVTTATGSSIAAERNEIAVTITEVTHG